jgi:hypothetical protein
MVDWPFDPFVEKVIVHGTTGAMPNDIKRSLERRTPGALV